MSNLEKNISKRGKLDELRDIVDSVLPDEVRYKIGTVPFSWLSSANLKRENISPEMPDLFADRLLALVNHFAGRNLDEDHPSAQEIALLEKLDLHLLQGGSLNDFSQIDELRKTAVGQHYFKQ
ncbi:MAG: hypothetical protein PHU71_01530 [Candidatus Gracilibacteria bacterium]|nr:hypothetical protein [Candidatus Gracilibacteria bacterium]